MPELAPTESGVPSEISVAEAPEWLLQLTHRELTVQTMSQQADWVTSLLWLNEADDPDDPQDTFERFSDR